MKKLIIKAIKWATPTKNELTEAEKNFTDIIYNLSLSEDTCFIERHLGIFIYNHRKCVYIYVDRHGYKIVQPNLKISQISSSLPEVYSFTAKLMVEHQDKTIGKMKNEMDKINSQELTIINKMVHETNKEALLK